MPTIHLPPKHWRQKRWLYAQMALISQKQCLPRLILWWSYKLHNSKLIVLSFPQFMKQTLDFGLCKCCLGWLTPFSVRGKLCKCYFVWIILSEMFLKMASLDEAEVHHQSHKHKEVMSFSWIAFFTARAERVPWPDMWGKSATSMTSYKRASMSTLNFKIS